MKFYLRFAEIGWSRPRYTNKDPVEGDETRCTHRCNKKKAVVSRIPHLIVGAVIHISNTLTKRAANNNKATRYLSSR